MDKALAGIKAVQTLSRLNRAHPQKHDCFVLDFQNNGEAVTLAFQDYYRTTLLAEETDPNKLHDLKADLDQAQVYTPEQVAQLVALVLGGAERGTLGPLRDACKQRSPTPTASCGTSRKTSPPKSRQTLPFRMPGPARHTPLGWPMTGRWPRQRKARSRATRSPASSLSRTTSSSGLWATWCLR